MSETTLVCAIESRDHIGEAPVWDAEAQRLIWCDHASGVFHEAREASGGWRETRRWDFERPLAAAFPRAAGGLVLVSGIEVLLMEPSGDIRPLASIDEPAVKLNDAKCDARGRLWATTLATDLQPHAGLYRIDPDGRVMQMLAGRRLANGLAWSPDGSVLYVVDSLDRVILAADFDMDRGEVGAVQTLVEFELGEGGPNGLAVDEDGALWIALTGGAEVRRYSAQGELLSRLPFAVPGPTSCAFGGEDGRTLFITTRSGRMPEFAASLLGIPEARMESSGDGAGAVWICRPGVAGPPSTPFAG